jgi:hypothetical protein
MLSKGSQSLKLFYMWNAEKGPQHEYLFTLHSADQIVGFFIHAIGTISYQNQMYSMISAPLFNARRSFQQGWHHKPDGEWHLASSKSNHLGMPCNHHLWLQ